MTERSQHGVLAADEKADPQKGFTLIELLIVGAILGIIASLVIPGIGGYGCRSRWEDSGMQVKWGVVAGCRISRDGGKTWIPEQRYRKIN